MDKQTRIFMTGATGFIGSYILRTLIASGYRNIVALKRATSKMDLVKPVVDQVEWIEGDLLDTLMMYEVIKDVQVVVHAAAKVSFDRREDQKILKVNEEGTRNLVNASIEFGLEKFIHISSIAVFARRKDNQEIDENTGWDYQVPATDYAISKYKAEMEVWRAGAEGLPVAILNPSLVLGAGFWDSGSASLFKKVYDGLKFYPRGINGFVDVRDVATATLSLLEKSITSERFIISGENRSYQDLINLMAKGLNKDEPSIALNPFLRELALLRAWILRTVFRKNEVVSRGTLRNAQHAYFFDSSKSKETLGLQYRSLENTIEETCQLFMEAAREENLPAKYLEIRGPFSP